MITYCKNCKKGIIVRNGYQLLEYNLDKTDILYKPLLLEYECPMDLHCSYTKDQILIAMDYLKLSSMRQGVLYVNDKKTDLFFISLIFRLQLKSA